MGWHCGERSRPPPPMRTKQPPSLKARAIAALARREHSRTSLARRLLAPRPLWGRATAESRPLPPDADSAADVFEAAVPVQVPSPEAVEAVLDELERLGLLSDERFAESWVRTRGGRLGAVRLRQELREQGISDTLIAAALSQSDGSEAQRAFEVWQRRFGEAPQTPQERARQQRFLIQRGFEPSAYTDLARRGFQPPEEFSAEFPKSR